MDILFWGVPQIIICRTPQNKIGRNVEFETIFMKLLGLLSNKHGNQRNQNYEYNMLSKFLQSIR